MPLFPFHKTLETIRSYDAWAEEYAARWGDVILAEDLDRFAGMLPAGGRTLDLGCGPGRDLLELHRRGLRAVGLDRSAGLLRVARRDAPAAVALGDLRRLPFASGTFDGVWACASLLHVERPNVGSALAESRRILCPQGAIYIAVKEGIGSAWQVLSPERRIFTVYYQMDDLVRQVESDGFRVVSASTSEDRAGREQQWINLFARRLG